MAEVYCDVPHITTFQVCTETDTGETVVEKVRLRPGEVVDIDDDVWKKLKEREAIESMLDNRELVVGPDAAKVKRLRENLVHTATAKRWITRLSAKAGDIATVGQEHLRGNGLKRFGGAEF